MFKSARWRSEKNKIKVVFKLQFKATQIPQAKWDALAVSLIPLDAGKPTARSEKAAVSSGSCQWEKPIHETVKLSREPKTGRISGKVYQILVSGTGSPKSALLGEATIDFADYAEAVKPASVSLPLRSSDSSAILHVTIQRLQDEVNGREIEDMEKMVKPQSRTLKGQLNNGDKGEDCKIPSGINSIIIAEKLPINGEVQMKFPSSRAMVLHAESNVNLKKSSSFDAISASGSDTSSGQYTPREKIHRNGNTHQDPTSLLSTLSNNDSPRQPILGTADMMGNHEDHRKLNTEWSASSAPDGSIGGSTNSSDESLRERMQCSNDSYDKLNNDLIVLSRQVEVSELELQALRKQVVKERRQVEDLSRDLCSMKEERDTLRKECEQLKASQEKNRDQNISNRQIDCEDLRSILQEMKQELNHEKNMNANLHLQLQKTQESNSELILAVKELEEMLEQKNREISCVKCDHMLDKPAKNDNCQGKRHENGFTHLQHSESNKQPFETQSAEEEQYALEVLVKERDIKMAFSLEQKISELNNEIELHRKDREDLEMQMEQLALDYEILKQENHDVSLKLEQIQLREQLRMQYECSAHLSIINELEIHTENLERELEKQAEAFEADLESLTCAKVEQEKKAIQLEEALRKARWKNVTTAEHLQEELRTLSKQMASMVSKDEKLTVQALAEAGKLRLQNSQLEKLLEKASSELVSVQDHYRLQLEDFATKIDLGKRQTEQLNMKLKDKSEELENKKKSEAEKDKAFFEEMLKLNAQIELLEREKNAIYQQLKHKDDSRDHMEKLKAAIEETEVLLKDRNMEKGVLQRECSLMKEEAKKLHEELNDIRLLEEEKEALNSELAIMKVEHNDSTSLLELGKENLRKQVLRLRGYLQKEEDASTIVERRSREGNTDVSAKMNTENKSNRSSFKSYDEEAGHLRSKNKPLEAQVKLKNAAHEDTRYSFSEDSLSNGSDEPENGPGEAEQNDPCDHENCEQKEARNMEGRVDGFQATGEENDEILLKANFKEEKFTHVLVDMDQETILSKSDFRLKVEEPLIGSLSDHGNLAGISSEIAKLRETNKSMEAELNEMQERYSEISLKFAEVEGERQQLVMIVRTLKNALKN